MNERDALLRNLGLAMREMSGLGVLHSAAMARKLGISATDMECLDLVSTGQARTPGELASRSGLTSGAITGVLDRLEKAGFLERQRGTDDRRKVYLSPTGKVAQVAEPLGGAMREAVSTVMLRYDDESLALALRFLTDVTDAARGAVAALSE